MKGAVCAVTHGTIQPHFSISPQLSLRALQLPRNHQRVLVWHDLLQRLADLAIGRREPLDELKVHRVMSLEQDTLAVASIRRRPPWLQLMRPVAGLKLKRPVVGVEGDR